MENEPEHKYRYGSLPCVVFEEHGIVWISPPPIAPKPKEPFQRFQEKVIRDLPLMQRVGLHFRNRRASLNKYYDRENGRILYFLHEIIPHVCAFQIEEFSFPAPLIRYFDEDEQPLPISKWIYRDSEPSASGKWLKNDKTLSLIIFNIIYIIVHHYDNTLIMLSNSR
jgi:hypothetical protein